MPAFTYLCQKVNISLFNDTITLYPKRLPGVVNESYPEGSIFRNVSPGFNSIIKFHHLKNLNYVHRHEPEHEEYHQDLFDRDTNHWHFRFAAPIDKAMLGNILATLVTHDVIAPAEKESMLEAYEVAQHDNPEDQGDLEYLALVKQLETIKVKADQLLVQSDTDANYIHAAQVAQQLYTNLNRAFILYKGNPSPLSYDLFKKRCNRAIAEARPVLEHHRGWKEVFFNLGIAISTLMVANMFNGLINKRCFFHVRTDSERVIDNFSNFLAVPLSNSTQYSRLN